MNKDGRPMRNPFVILREEFDDWAILFNPDTGHGFGLNPTGVFVWKLLDGKHSVHDLLQGLHVHAEEVPQEAGKHLVAFVGELADHGLAGYQRQYAHHDTGSLPLRPLVSQRPADSDQPRCGKLRYERPRLEPFGQDRLAHGNCHNVGSHEQAAKCNSGNVAGCGSGSSVGYACSDGTAAGYPPGCGGGGLRSPYSFGCGCVAGSMDYVPDCNSGNGAA